MANMRRRTRFLIGLLLVLTMGVSFTESVWAAACSPEMAGPSAAPGAIDDSLDMPEMPDMADADVPDQHDCMPGHAHDPSETDDHGPACPFSPTGTAQGCAAMASLPSTSASLDPPSPLRLLVRAFGVSAPHLLQSSAIFHPPKA